MDPEEPLTRLFDRAAVRFRDRPFLGSRQLPGELLSMQEFVRQARQLGRLLLGHGLRAGDRVALLSENRPRWCVAYAAILYAGGVVVPLDAQLGADALERLIAQSGARAAIASGALRPRLQTVSLPLPELVLEDEDGWESMLNQAGGRELPEVMGGDRPAAILYTSGTTARPKGVVLSHRNLQAQISGIERAIAVSPDDVLLMFLPLHHVLSQLTAFLVPAARGLRVVHVVPQAGADLLRAMSEEGVSILAGVPQLYHLMHATLMDRLRGRSLARRSAVDALLAACGWLRRTTGLNPGRLLLAPVHRVFGPGLRLLLSAGSALSPRVQRDYLALGFTLGQAYGLTETAGAVTVTPLEDIVPASVGRPLEAVEVRIHEPDARGVGEVRVRGPIVTRGYHERPDATSAAFDGDWLLTGDQGRLDQAGNLYLTGRLKEIIVLSSGKNVYPEEVEDHYGRLPSVSEVCVLARSRGGGEKLHAVVVPDWEWLAGEDITAIRDRIHFDLESASLELPAYQRVLSFEVRREPLPRTATRKIQRFLVQASLDEAAAPRPPDSPAAAERLRSPAGRSVESVLRKRVPADVPIQAGSHLELDLGLDSLTRMEALLDVEARLGIRIEDEEAAGIGRVDDLLRLATSRLGEQARPGRETGHSWTRLVNEAGPEHLPPVLRTPRGLASRALLRGLLVVTRLLARVFFRLRVEGVERLPERGPLLVCPNHVSFLDGFMVGASLPWRLARHGFVLGENTYISRGVAAPLARFAGLVPTDSSRHLRGAMQVGAAGLGAGRTLLLFPEGIRSASGRLQPLKQGAAILASELGTPIVPVVIEGTFEAWPRGRRWPRPHRVRVSFGAPLNPRPLRSQASTPDEAQRLITATLRQALLDLGARAGD